MKRKLDSEHTMAVLRNALVELLEEKPYETLSISEITKKAGLNRTTFYLFYESKDDLASDVCDAFLKEYTEIMSEFLFSGNQDSKEIIVRAFETHKKERRVIQSLWEIKTIEASPYQRMQNTLYQGMLDSLKKNKKKMKLGGDLAYYAEMFAVCAMTSIKWWIAHCDEYPAEYMAFCVITCIQNGMIHLLE